MWGIYWAVDYEVLKNCAKHSIRSFQMGGFPLTLSGNLNFGSYQSIIIHFIL
jgi:hypothetical protein